MERIQIEARGLTFDAWADGPQEGSLVLLLHGLPRTGWEWHHQLPHLARAGFWAVAPDLRGYSPGARPHGAAAYTNDEFIRDVLAIAASLGWDERAFHLVGTSIGAVFAWHIAGRCPDRVASLVCINIPHPGAMDEVLSSETGAQQQEKMKYFAMSRKEGNESWLLDLTYAMMNLPAEELEPYREALESPQARRAVYHWYRANSRQRNAFASGNTPLPPVTAPTVFVWPQDTHNISRETAEANARYVQGPYRLAILEGAFNFTAQQAPEAVTRILLEHLKEHAR